MSAGKTVAKNFAWLSIAELIARLGSTALGFLVANILGANPSGQLVFGFAFLSFFNLFADFGLTTLGVREIAKDPRRTSELGSDILSFQSGLSIVLYLIMVGLLLVLPMDQKTRMVAVLSGLMIIPTAVNATYIFQAHQRMEFIGILRVLGQLGYAVLGVAAVFVWRDVLLLPVIQFLTALAASVYGIYLLKKHFAFDFHKPHWGRMGPLMVLGLPFVSMGLLGEIYHNLDIILVQFMRSTTDVGYYGAGYRIINAVFMIGTMLATTFFPMLSASWLHSPGDLRRQAQLFAKSMGMIMIPITIGGLLTAPQLIHLLYFNKPDFVAAIPSFSILLLLPLIVQWNVCLGNMLTVADRIKAQIGAIASGAAVNVILNLVLIPRYDIAGAAAATVISEVVVGVYMMVLFQQQFGYLVGFMRSYATKPLLASIVMAGFIWLLRGLPTLALLPLAGIVYFGVLLALKGVPAEFTSMILKRTAA